MKSWCLSRRFLFCQLILVVCHLSLNFGSAQSPKRPRPGMVAVVEIDDILLEHGVWSIYCTTNRRPFFFSRAARQWRRLRSGTPPNRLWWWYPAAKNGLARFETHLWSAKIITNPRNYSIIYICVSRIRRFWIGEVLVLQVESKKVSQQLGKITEWDTNVRLTHPHTNHAMTDTFWPQGSQSRRGRLWRCQDVPRTVREFSWFWFQAADPYPSRATPLKALEEDDYVEAVSARFSGLNWVKFNPNIALSICAVDSSL